MCLMLYLATSGEQPLETALELTIEEVDRADDTVRQWLSLPTVRFVGAHIGCSCGFPHIKPETPIEYFDGVFKDVEDREGDLRSLRALTEDGLLSRAIPAPHHEVTAEAGDCTAYNFSRRSRSTRDWIRLTCSSWPLVSETR
jgi:hypothetical protein